MNFFDWTSLSQDERKTALSRPEAMSDPAVIANVASIMADVKRDGDKAVLNYTAKFDGVALDSLRIDISDCQSAWDNLNADDKSAIETAKANIERFHSAQIPDNISVETMPGVICRREARAITSAGLYVPGGTCLLYTSPSPRDS